MPSVMTHELIGSFHIDAARLGNLSAFYFYAYDPMQLPVGMLMDRYGPRRLMALACLICAAGSYLFAMHVLTVAEAGRFLMGFGSAFAFVGVLKIATIWLPSERFALVAGLVSALGMFGAMTGDITLAGMVNKYGWHHTVLTIGGIGIVLSTLMFLVIRDRKPGTEPSKLKVHEAMNFRHLARGLWLILRKRQIWINGAIGCCLYLPITAVAGLWGIAYLSDTYGFSRIEAATANSMIFLGFAVGGTFIGFISDYLRSRRMPLFFASLATFFTASIIIFVPGLPKDLVLFLLFLLGLCAGGEVIIFPIARENCNERLAGTALAFTNFFTMLGAAIFQPLIGYLLDLHTHYGVPNMYNTGDYRFALSVVPIGLLLGTILTLFIKETHAKTQT